MDKQRYARQLSLDSIGEEGQEKLLSSSVVIVGCGGLGAIAAMYLAAAGIGHLILIDGDFPDVSNLHRQVFFTPSKRIGKAQQLSARIRDLNPDIKVTIHPSMITKTNVSSFLSDAELVLECTDSVQAKYLVNDYCHLHRIPMVYAALHKEEGYATVFKNAGDSDIHLRDVFPVPDNNIPTCAEVGVMNTLAGIMGLIQASEAIKWLITRTSPLVGRLLIQNVGDYKQMNMTLKKSWTTSIEEVWKKENYVDPRTCDIPEIGYTELSENMDDYHIISILEAKDHVSIFPQVEHLPLSQIDLYNWEPEDEKPVVFYCNLGKKSMHVVMQLLEEDPELMVMSLKGGLKGIKNG